MKKIEAIIRKSKFEDVKIALHNVEVNFFSYWDVTGVGKIFVEFTNTDGSNKAMNALSGRKFATRVVLTSFYDPEMYHNRVFK
jgi:nitrogen regulatory protein PII